MEIPIIQLLGYNNEELGLYTYDPSQHKEEQAAAIIKNVIDDLSEDEEKIDNLHEEVDEHLKENFGIVRVFAAIVDTDIL